jgi:hypothetical protein
MDAAGQAPGNGAPSPAESPPSSAPRALASGLRRALRCWQVLLALWLGALLAALPAVLAPAGRLLALAERPVMAEIAGGLEAWQVLDAYALLLSGQAAPVVGRDEAAAALATPPALLAGLAGLAWGALLVPLLGGVVSAFLYGGALRAYCEAPAPFRLGRFLAGCWRWFGAFLLLGFLQAGLFVAGLLPLALLALGLGARLGPAGSLLAGLFVALLLAAWLLVFETARVQTVASGRRNPFRGLARAFSALFRRPGTLLAFYSLALLGLLALHALYRLVLLPLAPQDSLLPALLVQQSFIVLRLLARAVRLAGLASIFLLQ